MQSAYSMFATSPVTSDNLVETLIADNVEALRQGIELIERLDDGLYVQACQELSLSGVGCHFRHCIDFYLKFLAGLESGRINYDTRERDGQIETHRLIAIAKLNSIIAELGELLAVTTPAEIEVLLEDSSNSKDAAGWSRSSVKRELQFLLSHTIHHYALIALALRLHGFEPGAEFGIAPSTLRHLMTANRSPEI